MGKKFKINGYIRVEEEKEDTYDFGEALEEAQHLAGLQPENIYEIEECDKYGTGTGKIVFVSHAVFKHSMKETYEKAMS